MSLYPRIASTPTIRAKQLHAEVRIEINALAAGLNRLENDPHCVHALEEARDALVSITALIVRASCKDQVAALGTVPLDMKLEEHPAGKP